MDALGSRMETRSNRMRLAFAIFGIAAVIGCAGTASADPDSSGNDAAFLTALRSAGLLSDGDDQAIVAGHAVCSMANNGETGLQVVKQLAVDNPGLSLEAASKFAAVAADAYCPQHLQK